MSMLRSGHFVGGLLLCCVLSMTVACRPGERPRDDASSAATAQSEAALSPVQALQADLLPGFERALTPRPFVFPQDHGPHPTFRTEWWYFVGNLEGDDGRPFGFQLTFFRHALQADAVDRPSAWGSRDLYFAHFAVSDIEAERFHAFERFSRASLGLAGAQAEPFKVWIEDWRVAKETAEGSAAEPGRRGGDLLPAILYAAQDGVALDLQLLASRPPVAIGDGGLSAKSAEPGAASHYYSLSRIESRGTLTIDTRTYGVRGDIWLDREWSTSTLAADQVGWDWFSIQLDDGRDLMFFSLRRADGSIEPASHGVLIDAAGQATQLALADFDLDVVDRWQSPGGIEYPSAWHLKLPTLDLSLKITPRMANQELRLAVTYWEGAVAVTGRQGETPLSGHGYVELVGYTTP